MNFIQLPSGAILNPSCVRLVVNSDNGIRIDIGPNEKTDAIYELMSIEDFQNLLCGPAVSPIVSPVIDLDRLRVNAGCCFTFEGKVKHGVIEEMSIGFDEVQNRVPLILMAHKGNIYRFWPKDGTVEIDE
jgi:hypothetical protein